MEFGPFCKCDLAIVLPTVKDFFLADKKGKRYMWIVDILDQHLKSMEDRKAKLQATNEEREKH